MINPFGSLTGFPKRLTQQTWLTVDIDCLQTVFSGSKLDLKLHVRRTGFDSPHRSLWIGGPCRQGHEGESPSNRRIPILSMGAKPPSKMAPMWGIPLELAAWPVELWASNQLCTGANCC